MCALTWTYEFEKDGEPCEVELRLHVNLIPESGDGWNEPRERAHVELDRVEMLVGEAWQPATAALVDAADEWLRTGGGQEAALETFEPDPDDAYGRMRDEEMERKARS